MIKTVFVRASALMAWLLGIREELPGQGQRFSIGDTGADKPKPNRSLEYTTASGHHYIWLYRSECRRDMLKLISALAGSPEHEFNYHDAAICCEQVRAMDP